MSMGSRITRWPQGNSRSSERYAAYAKASAST